LKSKNRELFANAHLTLSRLDLDRLIRLPKVFQRALFYAAKSVQTVALSGYKVRVTLVEFELTL
jgi:hypothetical protein